jgi:hypothetical protein
VLTDFLVIPEAQKLYRMNFFEGGVKNTVYGEKVRDIRNLGYRITAAITTVTPDMTQRIWQEIE